jgi:AraC family transcriptional regulator of adaptative response / DNA-3-methyladenine glycosylase II
VAGWLEVRAAPRGALQVRIDARLAPAIARVLAACRHAFDIDCRPDEIAAALGPLAARRPGLRLPGVFDGFELGVRAILGQQITVRAAATLAGRLVDAFGAPIDTPFAPLARLFPPAEVLADIPPEQVAALGIVAARARAIVLLARAVTGGLRLAPGAEVEPTLASLRAIPGIGDWTAHYIAMRALHWPDAVPPGDVALLKALGTRSAKAAEAASAQWRPWRSYAVMHLWKEAA